MNTASTCPTCGCVLDAESGAEHCPRCLLTMALSPMEQVSSSFESRLRQVGDYELGRQIGAGGMGVVYEAHTRGVTRRVAIKLIRDFHVATPNALRRFTIEAEAAARLDHPNIVRIHEVGECEGQPFLVLDFVEGKSLSAKIAGGYSLAAAGGLNGSASAMQRTIARLMAKVAGAVHHAHTRGVLHRDIKPANILIDVSGEPHLTDFGLAKLLERSVSDPPTLTTTADTLGTPGYMSPEQVSGGNFGAGSDVYGLGAVLYVLLTGRPPFQGATPLELFKQIANQLPARPCSLNRSVHPDLEKICLKCLEKEPRLRYASAQALADDLENFAAGRAILARASGPAQRVRQWIKRNPVGAALIASLCLGLSASLVLLGIVSSQRREIELDRDQAFDESMQAVSQIWRDPATKSVTISARELAILAGRSPSEARGAVHQLVLAVGANDGPSSMAQRYAHLLGRFQEQMQRELGEKVVFHLQLLKRFNQNDETLARGDAHFVVVSAVEFLRAQAADSNVIAIAHTSTSREGVIFASKNSGVQRLDDLRGKAFASADPDLAISVSARARLFGAGLHARDLSFSTNIVDQGPESGHTVISISDTVDAVLRGVVDAGVTRRGQFERRKHLGLVMLDHFPEAPDVLAARSGLNPRFAIALRSVIASAATSWPEDKLTAFGPDTAEASFLKIFRAEFEQASRFDTR